MTTAQSISHPILSADVEAGLLRAYHALPPGDPARRPILDELVRHNLRTVWRQARRYWTTTKRLSGWQLSLEDLYAEGLVGLVLGVNTFDPAHAGAVRLASWAWMPITSAIKHAVRRERARLARERTCSFRRDKRSGDNLEVWASMLSTSDPPPRESLPAGWALLDSRSRRLLVLRYGLAGETEHTLRGCAAVVGITSERCRQLINEALDVLRGASTPSPVYRRNAS